MPGVHTVSLYSPVAGGVVTRVSIFDAHGQEFFCVFPRDTPKVWRKAREDAVEMITEAMRAGCEPGQVVRA
jgi:hypothetical protein